MDKIIEYSRGEITDSTREQINRQNRLAIRYMALTGVPVALINIAAQMIIKGAAPSLTGQSFWILIYFLFLSFIERKLIPDPCVDATLFIYLLEAPVMIMAIMLGTVLDPTHQALTFMMYMVVMPVFILDRPARVMGIHLLWNLFFLLLCRLVKDPQTWRPDLIHALEFQMASFTVTYVVLKLRYELIEGNQKIIYNAEHDRLTGLRNRSCLDRHMKEYIGKSICVVLSDLDNMTLYNDFYGREQGDKVLSSLARIMTGVFGRSVSYRYGGDQILSFYPDSDEDVLYSRFGEIRRQLHEIDPEHGSRKLNCSFSYVSGRPSCEEDLKKMFQLARIYIHRGRSSGNDGIFGGLFDETVLVNEIVETNMYTHIRPYEINELTGLPSVGYFIARSEELLDHVAQLERRPMAGYLNITRMKEYNDIYGYAKGDDLIRCCVRSLMRGFPGKYLASITGGEFAILCYADEIGSGLKIAQALVTAFSPEFNVSLKAGFCEYHPGDSLISLLDDAKAAYNEVRRRTDESWLIYDEDLAGQLHFQKYLIKHVDEAIEKEWIQIYFQPLIHSLTGGVFGLEALSRWDDPSYGFLSPASFIPVLEKEHLLYKVTLYAAKKALLLQKELKKASRPAVPVSVNLSRYDFDDCDLLTELTALTDACGLSPALLPLEITESVFIRNKERLASEIDRFRKAGFPVWMDDFGSEYSTLNLLKDLSIDLIKIDMNFLRGYTDHGRGALILSSVLEMSHSLTITTLIEGVETAEQFQSMRRMGCEIIQGYYFARPMPPAELFRLDLAFEGPVLDDYRRQMSGINLDRPMAFLESLSLGRAGDTAIQPAGIFELSGEELVCIAANAPMHALLLSRGMIGPGGEDALFVRLFNPPAAWLGILRQPECEDCRCMACTENQSLTVRLLAEKGGEAKAFLLIESHGEEP